jgi:hypothetical protein
MGAFSSLGVLHASPSYQFTPIEDPLATNGTEPWAISGNSIVGFYRDASGEHGFLFNGTTYTTLDVPGGTATSATGIAGTKIVGSFTDSSASSHGFTNDGGLASTYLTYDVPSSSSTKLVGISQDTSGSLSMVGAYIVSNIQHGFLISGGSFTRLDVPSRSFTSAISVSAGRVVGYDVDNNTVPHGFLYDGTAYTSIDDPLAGTTAIGGTFALGISGSNIVGSYNDANGLGHGFLYNGFTYTTIDHPLGVGGTVLFGIDGNKIVGFYTDAQGIEHGFLATPISQTFVSWEASYSVNHTPTATPWSDGVPDLLKYFLNIDPSRPMTAADRAALPQGVLTTNSGGSYITFTYRQYQSLIGLSHSIQTSSDLVTWSNDTLDIPTIISIDSVTGDPIMQVQVPISGAETFVRLTVTSSP